MVNCRFMSTGNYRSRKDQRPHLLFFANHYRGPGRSGGARTWHQVRELVKTFNVTLIIPRIDPLTQEVLSKADLPGFNGLNIKIADCRVGSRNSFVGRLIYQASSAFGSYKKTLHIGKPDVILAMGAPPLSALVGVLASIMKNVPILLDVRDIPLETAKELGLVKKKWLLRMAQIIEGYLFRRVDKIICVSNEMGEFVRERGVSREKIITNYIGYDNFDNIQDHSLKEYLRVQLLQGLDRSTRFIIFYAGTLATLVDIKTVLKAAEKIKSDRRVGFVIVGDGERKKFYEDWVVSKDLNVKFTGRVPKKKVHELCFASDICVYPLIGGGPATGAMLGNKIFDYLGAGKPVIYTGPDGAVSRLVSHLDVGVVLRSEDVNGLVETIINLFNHPEKLRSMGAKGKKAVYDKMTAQHSANALAEQLNQLLGKNL